MKTKNGSFKAVSGKGNRTGDRKEEWRKAVEMETGDREMGSKQVYVWGKSTKINYTQKCHFNKSIILET